MEMTSVLKLVVNKLDKLRIPYVLTGGLAVSYWGAPRTTHDIDIIIEIDSSKTASIIRAFDKEFYVSREEIESMLSHGRSFNLIHHKTGIKIDFWLVDKKDPHKVLEFSRALKKKIFGQTISIIAPEDLIIVKLKWCQGGESFRHLEDVKSVLRISKVDTAYIKQWAHKQGTLEIFNQISLI